MASFVKKQNQKPMCFKKSIKEKQRNVIKCNKNVLKCNKCNKKCKNEKCNKIGKQKSQTRHFRKIIP